MNIRVVRDIWNDTVEVRSAAGNIWLEISCDTLEFTPDEALKLAAAIRDAAILAKEKA